MSKKVFKVKYLVKQVFSNGNTVNFVIEFNKQLGAENYLNKAIFAGN